MPDNSSLLSKVLPVCIQKNVKSMRKSKDGRIVFKLPVEVDIPQFLQVVRSFTHTEIIQELLRPEWVHDV